ncbi:TraU family protein [Suttonella indologenes]|uniref:Integrating conjugative element protein, PFL_4710 family n=1 Tax=Suttonella indologenes TaxID=13276 RepID=A0A380MK87_9GAMM|nr:TraU family protein [Suttonella indologenes]SUO90229.1 integrating conjugative element protein, PFL_4710 family [Suttonella indologenes]
MRIAKMKAVGKKTVMATAIALAFIQPARADFSSLDLGQTNLQQLTDCLEYTFHGLTLRVIYYGWGYYWFWTPNVSHNSPDMLAITHAELNDIPYSDYNRVFGTALKSVSNVGFAKLGGSMIGLDAEIGGGRYRHEAWGQHQSVQFTEASVIGNPSAMVIDAFTWDGLSIPREIQTSAQQLAEGKSEQYLEDFVEGKEQWTAELNGAFSYNQVMKSLAKSPVIKQIKRLIREIDKLAASLNGRVGHSPFCPVNQQAFQPFYLSGIDAYAWRMGYPVTDPDRTMEVLNPLAGTIGTEGEIWGYLYPREGAVNQQESAKVAAVAAVRAADILAEGGVGRLYREPRYKMARFAWSKVHPTSSECRLNIAHTGIEEEERDRYAWTMWTNHRCDLYRAGKVVAFVPLGPIRVTPSISD